MKLWKLVVVFIVLTFCFYGSLAYTVKVAVQDIDNNGGVERVLERVWKGKHGGQ